MATTPTYERVVVEKLPDAATLPKALDEIRDGLLNAMCELDEQWIAPHFDAWAKRPGFHEGTIPPEPPFVPKWGAHYEEAVDEILPDVARMLSEAINKRLPWTWEPER